METTGQGRVGELSHAAVQCNGYRTILITVSLRTGKVAGDRMETMGQSVGLGVNHCTLLCSAMGTGQYHYR